jgi:hypothetical protein
MTERFFKVKQDPKAWADARKVCHIVVTTAPWERTSFKIGDVPVKGRKAWGASKPVWKNEVIYYNQPLAATLNRITVHHANNSNSVMANEKKQQGRGYAALGYHFFINKNGEIYEGRPLEVMGSNSGTGVKSGPLNDPDWGAIGIVLQGDYHHADDWFLSEEAPDKQMKSLEKLIVALKNKYSIDSLLMHREVEGRKGKDTVCPGDHLVPKIESLRKKLDMKGKE